MRREQLIEIGERLLASWALKKKSSLDGTHATGTYLRHGFEYLAVIRWRNIPATESDDMVFTFSAISDLQNSLATAGRAIYCYVVWHEKDSIIRGLAFDVWKGNQIPTWDEVQRGYRVKIRKLGCHTSDAYIFREFVDGEFHRPDLDALDFTPGSTEGERVATYRKKQQKFRTSLLDRGSRCEVTGMSDSRMLRASHILPWCYSDDEQRLDPDNGILLTPNYDAAFDNYLITFADDGSIQIAPTLSTEDAQSLGISSTAKITVTAARAVYLRMHRDRFNELNHRN